MIIVSDPMYQIILLMCLFFKFQCINVNYYWAIFFSICFDIKSSLEIIYFILILYCHIHHIHTQKKQPSCETVNIKTRNNQMFTKSENKQFRYHCSFPLNKWFNFLIWLKFFISFEWFFHFSSKQLTENLLKSTIYMNM